MNPASVRRNAGLALTKDTASLVAGLNPDELGIGAAQVESWSNGASREVSR